MNFYLETHATPHNIHATPHYIYFIRLRILPRILGTLYWRVDDPLYYKQKGTHHRHKAALFPSECRRLRAILYYCCYTATLYMTETQRETNGKIAQSNRLTPFFLTIKDATIAMRRKLDINCQTT